jgi:hypothetical protein
MLNTKVTVPVKVKDECRLGLDLILRGCAGGTETGITRAKQLSSEKHIDVNTLVKMRAWFSRHGPDAQNGGTSYPGYLKWVNDGCLVDSKKKFYRGAVAWLIWGGDAAYSWLKSSKIRKLLLEFNPKLKQSSGKILIQAKFRILQNIDKSIKTKLTFY